MQTASSAGVVGWDNSVDAGAGVSGGSSTNAWEFTPSIPSLTVGIGATYGAGGTYGLNSGRTYSAMLSGAVGGAVVSITTYKGAISSVTSTPVSGGSGYAPNSTICLEVTGDGGTGGVVLATTNSSGFITAFATTPIAGGGGYASTPSGNVAASTSQNFVLLSASTSNGNISVNNTGGADLILDGISSGPQGTLTIASDADILNTNSATASSATASANSANAENSTVSGVTAATLSLTAPDGIGTLSNPLETSVNNLAASGGGLFLANNTALTVTTNTNIQGSVSISTIGNLTLNNASLGSATSNVSLTATAGTITTTGNVLLIADTLTISAEQIGDSSSYSPAGAAYAATDVIQTNATVIDATADYGGIYISNNNTGMLTLTAAAVGPTPNNVPTNNIEIYSAGSIDLLPQTSTLPGAGSTLVGIYNPGGTVTLVAGQTLSAGGSTVTPSSGTFTVANPTPPSGSYYDVYTGTLIIGSSQITNSGTLSGAGYGPLLTETNTAEVAVFAPIAIANSGPLEISASTLENGGSFTGSSITIEELGTTPLEIAGNLVLIATGSIVFLDPQNTIQAESGYSIQINAGTGVAALGNLVTGGSNITITAVGNVGIGTVNAGAGAVSISSAGSIFNNNGGNLSITASSTKLNQGAPPVVAQGNQSTSTSPSSNLAQLELNAAQALATAAAASAQAAADQTTANAFQAELNSIQVTIATDQNTYQADVTATNAESNTVDSESNTVNNETWAEDGLSEASAVAAVVAAYAQKIAIPFFIAAGPLADIPVIGESLAGAAITAGGLIDQGADAFNTDSAVFNLAAANLEIAITAESITLGNDQSTLTDDQLAQTQAYAQLLADQDTETAIAAAYNVAQQAAISEQVVAQQDQAVAQADSALVQAASEASAQNAQSERPGERPGNRGRHRQRHGAPLNVSGPLTMTGEAPSGTSVTNLTVSAPITIGSSVLSITANGSTWTITTATASGFSAGQQVTLSGVTPTTYDGTWTVNSAPTGAAPDTFSIASTTNPAPGSGGNVAAAPAGSVTVDGNGSPVTVSANITAPGSIDLEAPSSAALQNEDDLTMSSGTVESTASSVALSAGDVVDIASGATIEASSTITLTADANDATYQGQVTFGSATLTLPTTITEPNNTTIAGPTWASLGFGPGNPITVSGAVAADDGAFTIASGSAGVSANGYTLTLTNSGLSAGTATVTVAAAAGADDASNPTPASVTVAGTLSAASALINVPSASTRATTFNITPSTTTPITVAGSGQATDTLYVDFDTAGLAVTVATTGTQTVITAPGMAPVTFSSIALVDIIDAAGGASLALAGTSGQANTMSVVGTGQGAGIVTLNGATLSFSGVASLNYQGGKGDTISVTPFATSAQLPWNVAVTVAGSSGSPASLTYNSVSSLTDAVTATGADAGTIGSPGPGLRPVLERRQRRDGQRQPAELRASRLHAERACHVGHSQCQADGGRRRDIHSHRLQRVFHPKRQ